MNDNIKLQLTEIIVSAMTATKKEQSDMFGDLLFRIKDINNDIKDINNNQKALLQTMNEHKLEDSKYQGETNTELTSIKESIKPIKNTFSEIGKSIIQWIIPFGLAYLFYRHR